MLACILIPGFQLRVALRKRPRLALEPAALAPLPGSDPVVGPITAAAEAAGIRPGMRLGEALATCPSLALVEQDPAAAENAWEKVVRRLEGEGFAVEPAAPGCLYVETKGVERLYGGVEPALKRALAAVGSRVGCARGCRGTQVRRPRGGGRRTPGPGARRRREGDVGVPRSAPAFPSPARRGALRRARGARHAQDRRACIPSGHGSRRAPGAGRAACMEPGARRGQRPRQAAPLPPTEIAERLEFPEAVGNEVTLNRALAALIERALGRPERTGGLSARSRSRPSSLSAAPGEERSPFVSRPPTTSGFASRLVRSSRSFPPRSRRSGSSSSSSRNGRVSSSSSFVRRAPSFAAG